MWKCYIKGLSYCTIKKSISKYAFMTTTVHEKLSHEVKVGWSTFNILLRNIRSLCMSKIQHFDIKVNENLKQLFTFKRKSYFEHR